MSLPIEHVFLVVLDEDAVTGLCSETHAGEVVDSGGLIVKGEKVRRRGGEEVRGRGTCHRRR